MKAIYKKSVLEKLYEILHDSERRGKKIDFLLLTPEEMAEVRSYCEYPWARMSTPSVCYETFRIVELKSNTGDPFRPWRFPVSPYTFHGYDIVVAPAEFH